MMSNSGVKMVRTCCFVYSLCSWSPSWCESTRLHVLPVSAWVISSHTEPTCWLTVVVFAVCFVPDEAEVKRCWPWLMLVLSSLHLLETIFSSRLINMLPLEAAWCMLDCIRGTCQLVRQCGSLTCAVYVTEKWCIGSQTQDSFVF